MKNLAKPIGGVFLLLMMALGLTGCNQNAGVYAPAVSKLTERADALHAAGNLQEAINRLNAAADLAPDSAPVQYNLGVLCSEKKEWSQAENHLEKSLTLTPSQPNALFTLAFTYESHYDDLMDAAKTQAKGAPKPTALTDAQSYRQKALATYDDYLKLAPASDPHREEAQAAVESLRHS